jgi:hypothetical protein
MHLCALGNEQVGNGVADGDPPSTAGVERAGGVGGHELEIDLPALQRVVLPVGVAGGHDLAQHVVEPRRRQEEVEEARAGDVDALQVRRRRRLEVGLDPVSDLTGRELHCLCHLHRDGAGPVTSAAIRIAGLERDTVRRLGKPGRTQRVAQAVAELVTNHEVGQATRSASPLRRSYCPFGRDIRVVVDLALVPSAYPPSELRGAAAAALPASPQEPELATGDQRKWRAGTVSVHPPS